MFITTEKAKLFLPIQIHVYQTMWMKTKVKQTTTISKYRGILLYAHEQKQDIILCFDMWSMST